MRGRASWWLVLVSLGVGCSKSVSGPGVERSKNPTEDTPACQHACGENTPADPPDNPSADTRTGDPVEYLGTAEDRFRGFVEPVEVAPFGEDRVAFCTGVQGLAIYHAKDSCCLSLEATIRPAPTRDFPRCQHFAFDGKHVFIANRGDELLPEAFITTVDVTNLKSAQTIDTYFGDGATSFEGLALGDQVLYGAQHEKGLGIFQIEANGALKLVRTVTEGIENAWQPVVSADKKILYLADAQGGLVIFSLEDPLAPQFLKKVPTLGTLKDLALSGNHVYGASGSSGMEIFDVTNPEEASRVRHLDTPGSALGIAANDRFVVLSDWNDVRIYRRTDPSAPTLIGHQKAYDRGAPTPLGRILDVALKDDTIFMAEWSGPQSHRIIRGVDAPDLVTASSLELSRTAPSETTATTLVVENIGAKTLEIERLSIGAPFTVELTPTEIPAGGRALATVRFTPDSTDGQESILTLKSNDPDEPEHRIPVVGNQPGLRPGDEVPELTFTDLDGFTHRLRDLRGRPVLLAYFATF